MKHRIKMRLYYLAFDRYRIGAKLQELYPEGSWLYAIGGLYLMWGNLYESLAEAVNDAPNDVV